MAHKRCVVHVAYDAGKKMNEFFGDDLPVNMDILIAGLYLPMLESYLNMS